MCRRNAMIRNGIRLYHDISGLDPHLYNATCQCDLYTPPYKGCLSLQALSIDTLKIIQKCKIDKGANFEKGDSSCVIKYRENEGYGKCTHNLTLMITVDRLTQETVREWLFISATDNSGVYVNCRWTGSLTTDAYNMDSTEKTTTLTSNTTLPEHPTFPDLSNTSLCDNCTTPPVKFNKRYITLSEVADQVDILIATVSGIVLAFLVLCFVCLCRSCSRTGKLVVTPAKPKRADAQVTVTAEVATISHYKNVFIDTGSAEIKEECGDSGSYSVPASNDSDDDNINNMQVHVARRSSDDCYDNAGFEY